MKIVKFVPIILIALCLSILIGLIIHDGTKELTLPEGYQLLCSIEEDKHTVIFPNGGRSSYTWGSRRQAIRAAINWDKMKDDPENANNFEWLECNGK